MNEAAPITWLIQEINAIVSGGAAATATALVAAVLPLASTCFGIYIILICINYWRGAETEPVIDFGLRIASFAVVVGLGLNASNYVSIVIPIVTGLGSGLASAVSGGVATAGSLDQLALFYFDILDKGYESANSLVFPFNIGPGYLYLIKAVVVLVGLIPFLVAATLSLIVADVGSIIVSMLGPIFFAFLLFPATRQYFSAWVNTAFSYALIPVIVAVIATISVSMAKAMLSTSGTLDQVSLKSVFLASMGNLTLLFLLKQVSSLASSLSAGGINAGMPGSIGTLAQSINSSIQGSRREGSAGFVGSRLGKMADKVGGASRSAISGASYGAGYGIGRAINAMQNRNSIRKAG